MSSRRGPSASVCHPWSGAAAAAGRCARGDEGPAAGPGVDQPARGEQVHGSLDGDRARAVPAHQLADRREPVAGPPRRDRRLQLFHDGPERVTVRYEHCR